MIGLENMTATRERDKKSRKRMWEAKAPDVIVESRLGSDSYSTKKKEEKKK